MICPKCGAEIESDHMKCSQCGWAGNSQLEITEQYCAYHSGRLAVSMCHTCGVELCETCEEWIDGVPYCHDCANRPSEAEQLKNIALVDTSTTRYSASFGSRFIASLIDFAVMGCLFGILMTAFWLMSGNLISPFGHKAFLIDDALFWGLFSLSTMFYFVQSISAAAQTPGMAMMDLAVVTDTGVVLDYRTAVLRFFALFISIVSLIGVVWIFWDPQKKSLHDRITNTRVVRLGGNF